MVMKTMNDFDAPIPGENFTSDTKNYAWHRPPKFTDLDEAIEHIAKHLSMKNNAITLLTMIENGFPINILVRTFLLGGVGNGKWSVDYALLLAGPTAKIMIMMADGAKIKYNLGLEEIPPPTSVFLNFMGELDADKLPDAIENVETDELMTQAEKQTPISGAGGFMSPRADTADDVDLEGNV